MGEQWSADFRKQQGWGERLLGVGVFLVGCAMAYWGTGAAVAVGSAVAGAGGYAAMPILRRPVQWVVQHLPFLASKSE